MIVSMETVVKRSVTVRMVLHVTIYLDIVDVPLDGEANIVIKVRFNYNITNYKCTFLKEFNDLRHLH